jgi:hypothetical protein
MESVADWRGEKRGPGGGAGRVKDRALRTIEEGNSGRGAWLKREADICMQRERAHLRGRGHAARGSRLRPCEHVRTLRDTSSLVL